MDKKQKDAISLKDYTFQGGEDLKRDLASVRRCICDMMGELATKEAGDYLMKRIAQSLFTLNHLIEDVDFVESRYEEIKT